MKLYISLRARQDLRDIRDYLTAVNPNAAEAVIRSIRSAIARIVEHPLAQPRADDDLTRIMIDRRFGYKIFYEVRTRIEILHVRHGSRSPDWRSTRS